jgi:hypothetical protein
MEHHPEGKMKKATFLLIMLAALGTTSCKNENGGEGPPPNNNNNNTNTPRTEVPDEIVGAWESSPIDFVRWENYQQGYYAGRDAVPSREAMVFAKNGDAKFYRYEFVFNFYEELIDCVGTVTFNGDGTFTFYPVRGRKRYNDLRNASNSYDRALTSTELNDPKLAGKRAYVYDGSLDPPGLQITVPSSPTYEWYKKE